MRFMVITAEGRISDVFSKRLLDHPAPVLALSGLLTVVVVDGRPFVLGLLGLWVRTVAPACELVCVQSVETGLSHDALLVADLVLIATGCAPSSRSWLRRQTEALRERRADVPIVVVLDDDEQVSATLSEISGVFSCILTSSELRVVAAVLHLVTQGGDYRPVLASPTPRREPDPPISTQRASPDPVLDRLTPRERAVFELLEQGLPNKIIAYRLGLSQSTVKAHVHSIISKLNVRNRIEVVMSTRERGRMLA